MTDEQLDEFRELLRSTSAELQASLNESAGNAAPVSPDNAIGRLTRQDAMQAQQMALEIRRRNTVRLQQVELAMRRMESGSYGICSDDAGILFGKEELVLCNTGVPLRVFRGAAL